MDQEKLFNLMDEFIAEQAESFSLKEGLSRFRKKLKGKKVPHLAETFEHMLLTSGQFFSDDQGKDTTFLSRASFFRGVEFRVMPTRDELREGILIPGHRFVPFCHPYMPSHQCDLIDDQDQPVPVRVVRKNWNALAIYHTLLGPNDMLEWLVEDQESNADVLMDGSNLDEAGIELDLTVFDIVEFYARHNVQEGDFLTLKVLDWENGEYSIRHTPSAEMDGIFGQNRLWCEALEKSLLNVFERYGCMNVIPDQLALAYFHGGDALASTPGIGFGAFLKQSAVIEIAHLGGDHGVLWRKGESPEDDIGRSTQLCGVHGVRRQDGPGTLNGILQDLGLSCSETEVEAYFLDAHSRGETEPNEALRRLFDTRESLQFRSEEQLMAFNKRLIDLWEKTFRTYNPLADMHVAPCRAKALELLEIQIDYLRSLDKRGVMPEQLPGDVVFEFGKLTSLIEEALRLFNQPADVGKKEAKSFMTSFQMMEAPIHLLIDEMEAHLGGQYPGLRVLDSSEKDDSGDSGD